jgi:hypothetical protein
VNSWLFCRGRLKEFFRRYSYESFDTGTAPPPPRNRSSDKQTGSSIPPDHTLSLNEAGRYGGPRAGSERTLRVESRHFLVSWRYYDDGKVMAVVPRLNRLLITSISKSQCVIDAARRGS